MAWLTPTDLTTGCLVTAASWNQSVHANPKYLKGLAGCVVIEDMMQVSGCGNFTTSMAGSIVRFDVRNNDNSDTSSEARIRAFTGGAGAGDAYFRAEVNGITGWNVGVDNSDSDSFKISTGAAIATNNLVIDTGGGVYINDNANAKATIGLTINQGANDDEILTFKSSDVAHSFTDATEQDTWGLIRKEYPTEGAVRIEGISDPAGGAAARSGIVLVGKTTNTHTGKSTSSSAISKIESWVLSSSTAASPAGGDNAFSFVSGSRTCLLVDGSGELRLDAGSNASAFDAYADAPLLRALDIFTSDPATVLESQFADWMAYQREDLERAGVVTFNADGHHFVSVQKLLKLLTGAVWQGYEQGRRQADENAELRARLARLENAISSPRENWLRRAAAWGRRLSRPAPGRG